MTARQFLLLTAWVFWDVRALANVGVAVSVPALRVQHARGVLAAADLGSVGVFELDLGDQTSVQKFVAWYRGSGRKLDILVNNATIMACPETRVGPGWEAQFATSHLGHFTLVNELLPWLADGGARVISLSSTGHKLSGIHFDDPHFMTGYDKWEAYGQAKTANSLFAVELDARGADHGVRAFAVNPGGIMTGLQRHLSREEMVAAGWMNRAGEAAGRFQDSGTGRGNVGLDCDRTAIGRQGWCVLRGLRHCPSSRSGIRAGALCWRGRPRRGP